MPAPNRKLELIALRQLEPRCNTLYFYLLDAHKITDGGGDEAYQARRKAQADFDALHANIVSDVQTEAGCTSAQAEHYVNRAFVRLRNPALIEERRRGVYRYALPQGEVIISWLVN